MAILLNVRRSDLPPVDHGPVISVTGVKSPDGSPLNICRYVYNFCISKID